MNREVKTSKAIVYNKLVNEIISGKYEPNSIITEKMLSSQFDCSRAPIREALIELCKDNYLKSIPRAGYMLIAYSPKDIADILDFRLDVEIASLRRAFPKLSEEKIKSLDKRFLEGYYHPLGKGSIVEHWSDNQKFHLALCSLSNNSLIYSTLQNILVRNAGFYHFFYKEVWAGGPGKESYHKKIIESLLDNDLNTACSFLEKDIIGVKDRLTK